MINDVSRQSQPSVSDALLKIRLEVGQDPNFLSADIYRIPTASEERGLNGEKDDGEESSNTEETNKSWFPADWRLLHRSCHLISPQDLGFLAFA